MSTLPDAAELRFAIIDANSTLVVSLLNNLLAQKKIPLSQISSLHDAILFCLAYPSNQSVYDTANLALQHLLGCIKNAESRLQNSGMSGTTIVSSFSLELLEWMQQTFPEKMRFHSFDNDKEDLGEDLKQLLPSAEAEILSNEWNKTKLFRELCKGKITLEKLLHIFKSDTNRQLASYVFNKTKTYVSIQLCEKTASRSTARAISYTPYFHTSIEKKCEPKKIISQALPAPKKLSIQEINRLVFHARMMLASLGRETDPVTNCSIQETEFYCLERGFTIAFFYLQAPYRLAFDAYVGYLMYKNGIPVAYGGAWIFFDRALIGINIFDAFRGGESAFLFSQLLRAYSQRFQIKAFSVEPYQYGKNNREGLLSGAYWFYYRFGFRSDEAALRELVAAEQEKIQHQKNYKTPLSVLKQFTRCNISLELKPVTSVVSSNLSLRISDSIAWQFEGDRKKAIEAGEKKLKELFGPFDKKLIKKNDVVFQNWCLALLTFQVRSKPNVAQKKAFYQMLSEKATGKESAYLHELNKLMGFFESKN